MRRLIALLSALLCALAPTACGAAGENAEPEFRITVSYADRTADDSIYLGALNTDKLIISSVQHLPIYRLDTAEELERFRQTFGETLAMDRGCDDIPSFGDAAARYDESFFKDNSLMLVYVGPGGGGFRCGVSGIQCGGGYFRVHVKRFSEPEAADGDMYDWFITAEVPDSAVDTCTEFDADMDAVLY